MFMTSSALAASIRPPLKAETPTHATEYAKTCTGAPQTSSFKNHFYIFPQWVFSRSLHLSYQYGVGITGQISQKRNRTSAVWDVFDLLQHASLPAAVLQVVQQFVQCLGDVNKLVRLSIGAEGCEH